MDMNEIYSRYVTLTGDDFATKDKQFINELNHRKNCAIGMVIITIIFGSTVVLYMIAGMQECRNKGQIAIGDNGIKCVDKIN